MTGLSLGRYTVQETAAPAGYALDPGVQVIDLTTDIYVGLLTSAFINTLEIP
ncbi:MAG: hypothetical protein GWN07_13725, partial [Actinobacteria bacterium]|nr:hypothetical protein [Actinomycetota bacterium]NIS31402.1 hypothetical protein [Actinomycetota bacterium]NIU66517.1 hypothetical protein [Actinomycetota bacterium]NIW28329.1 hypothetical protein [Actinomycetota bacterium]NIX20828.1 hypothetical protein [Actinomycetota bacterium]